MIVGIVKEKSPETRVSMLPEIAAQIIKNKINVLVEEGAGSNAAAMDEDFKKAGVEIASRERVLRESDIILALSYNFNNEELSKGKILIGIFQPLMKPELVKQWADQGLTVFSMDMLPRTTRAQSMDVLSSQANIAGYKSVLTAANIYPRYFPMLMTAAGSIAPAKILILGAGVAGLQAIATAKRLGAVVEVFDSRAAVKEEVMSLGARFVEVEGARDASNSGGYAVEQTEEYLNRQKEKIAESIQKADIVITTAQIPGKKAPILISSEMIAKMRNGSLIIDIAASTGGNTPHTQDGKTVNVGPVSIVGAGNLPASMPYDASRLYGKNIFNFLQLICKEGSIHLNWDDDLVKGACICHDGNIVNEKIKSLIQQA